MFIEDIFNELAKKELRIVFDQLGTPTYARDLAKICLNIISTMVMIMFGRIEKGQMSHLIANNKKLIDRKLRIQKLLKT